MRLLHLLCASMLVFALNGCVVESPVPPGYAGPPPFYPYDYYYYPSVRVYFQLTTGYYYYYSNGHWIRAVVLPPEIHLDPRDRHPVRIEADKPYLKQPDHERQYQPRPDYRPDRSRDYDEREQNRKTYERYERHQQDERERRR